MNKNNIRKKLLSLRRNLPQQDVTAFSEKICQEAFGILGKAKKVACYIAINNEVEPRLLLDQSVSGGIEVFVPAFFVGSEQYYFSKFRNWESLEAGPFNILQPVDGKTVSVDLLDVVFVPGVAFDKKGVRLGYGKGIYDRLLARSKVLKIGLAYDFQIVDKLPKEEHDLVMDIVVTEKRILRQFTG